MTYPRALLDLLDHCPQAAVVVHLRRPAAALADDVMVVGGLAQHVGVLAIRQVEAFHEAQVQEHIQRPEDRRPTHGQAASTALADQLGSGEVPVVLGHHGGDAATWFGPLVARSVQGGQQWFDGAHLRTIARVPSGRALVGWAA